MKPLTRKVHEEGFYTYHSYFDKEVNPSFLLMASRNSNRTQEWYEVKVWLNDERIETWQYENRQWVRQSDGYTRQHLKGVLLTLQKLGHFPKVKHLNNETA